MVKTISNTITLVESQVNQLMPTWTGIRIERGPNPTNLAAFSLVALLPYVQGQTTYTYLDPTGASSDWYRATRYAPSGLLGPFSPAWPVTPIPITSGDGARRSLKNCRRMLARRLRSLQVVTCTADGGVDGLTIQSTALITATDPQRYNGWWAMPTDGVSAGQIRVIPPGALNVSSGILTMAAAMTSQIVRGTQVEMHKLLPPEELGGLLGLRQALNLALAECWVLDRQALAATSDTVTYDISSLGDWLDPEAIVEFYGPLFANNIPLYPWPGFNARREGSVVDLDVASGLAPGAAMKIELTRPADTLIKVNGAWVATQQGFETDNDECLLQPIFLAEVALVHCYGALADATTGVAQKRYQLLHDNQRKKVNIAKWTGLPHPPERANHAGAAYDANDWLSYIR